MAPEVLEQAHGYDFKWVLHSRMEYYCLNPFDCMLKYVFERNVFAVCSVFLFQLIKK